MPRSDSGGLIKEKNDYAHIIGAWFYTSLGFCGKSCIKLRKLRQSNTIPTPTKHLWFEFAIKKYEKYIKNDYHPSSLKFTCPTWVVDT